MTAVGNAVLKAPATRTAPPAAAAGWWRRQPPVYSPLSLGALARAAMSAGVGADPRRELETTLRAAYGADAVILTDSGTHALELAISTAWGIAGADVPSVVAIPAFSCYDVATAAVGSGLSVALYDVDPETLAPDLDSLRSVLEGGVRIVVATHLYGYPIAWDALERLAAEFGAMLIEDAAQGHGGRWGKKPAGALGPMSVLSFGRGKGWTGSRGGALLLRRPGYDAATDGLLAPARAEEFHALLTGLAQWWLGRPSWYWLPSSLPWLGLGETRYHDPGPLCGMTRAAARLVRETRPLALTEMFARRCNAWDMLARLSEVEHARTIRTLPGADPGFLRLPLRLSRGWSTFADQAEASRLGVAASYPRSLAELPAVQDRLVDSSTGWPGAETLVRELVTLPTHSRVSHSDRRAMVGLL